jgi:lysophospholipase L1-like esterase
VSWPRARELAGSLVLAGASVAVVLALFEAGLRVAGHRALYEMYSTPWTFWVYDADLGWFHEPEASGRFVGPRPWPVEFEPEVSINSLGLRGPELPPRAEDELRVLFLGDSLVAAFEVTDDLTFVRRIEPELGRRLGRSVRAINGGVRGYGTDQYLLLYEERGRALEPDIVVVFVSGNDPNDNRTLHEPRRPFGKPALVPNGGGALERVGWPVPRYGACEQVHLSLEFRVERGDSLFSRAICRAQMGLFDHSSLFSFLTVSLAWNEGLLERLYNLGNPQAATRRPTPRADVWLEHTRSILHALLGAIARDGAAVLVTGSPRDVANAGGEALAQPGVWIQDLAEVWEEKHEVVRWKHDSHFNPEGHRRVAETLLPALDEAARFRPAHIAGAGR